MRWNWNGVLYTYGEKHRVRRVFLWWPVVICGEARWLEWGEVRERYVREFYEETFIPDYGVESCYRDVWKPIGWGSPERMIP